MYLFLTNCRGTPAVAIVSLYIERDSDENHWNLRKSSSVLSANEGEVIKRGIFLLAESRQ